MINRLNLTLLLFPALAMSLGWGIRGDYGHEAGAMIAGALVALAICLQSKRKDWLDRVVIIAMAGAVGWAFGGQMSYGVVIGYTASSSFRDVFYGYACLFAIGAMWGGIGAGILALALTEKRSFIESLGLPLVLFYAIWLVISHSGLSGKISSRWSFNDTDWVAGSMALIITGSVAIASSRHRAAARFLVILAAGWLAGLIVLNGLLRLRMTPPRSDNWAGCAGLTVALILYLILSKNRAALMLSLYGLLAGGIGFAFGDFIQMIGRAQWGPIARFASLQGLDYWKWMEMLFGMIMGFGVALGIKQLLKLNLKSPLEDVQGGLMRSIGLIVLFVVMPWENIVKNVRAWTQNQTISDSLLNVSPQKWILIVAILLTSVFLIALARHRKQSLPFVPATQFGKTQLLLLMLVWLFVIADFAQMLPVLKARGVLFVQVKFWLLACVCSMIAILSSPEMLQTSVPEVDSSDPSDGRWLPGWRFWLIWVMVPFFLFVLAKATLSMHSEPLPGSQLRFAVY